MKNELPAVTYRTITGKPLTEKAYGFLVSFFNRHVALPAAGAPGRSQFKVKPRRRAFYRHNVPAAARTANALRVTAS